MYKMDLALNNLQLLICYKTKPTQTKQNETRKQSDVFSVFEILSDD